VNAGHLKVTAVTLTVIYVSQTESSRPAVARIAEIVNLTDIQIRIYTCSLLRMAYSVVRGDCYCHGSSGEASTHWFQEYSRDCVYCALRTESLKAIRVNVRLQRVNSLVWDLTPEITRLKHPVSYLCYDGGRAQRGNVVYPLQIKRTGRIITVNLSI
jgi:hypothetical protein